MKITFSDKKLRKMANDDNNCLKEMGKNRAKFFRLRLNQLAIAETLEDIRHLPGNYHALIGNRKGQWACDLDQPYRLIFKPNKSPIPTDEHGAYIWLEIKGVEVVEIINYHKEK